ncbi:hypothetical protein FH972_021731 [Carpinus fangiana]|uniref:Zn(2)-C6 fungal-type domain-containing protein n=1 Tax=Carpinus fangiana TaxID=176857 RepID=A0A5N6KQ57_9ROSI|nr:hypothetical protein FH972_021731 [Carpinus fangiana]
MLAGRSAVSVADATYLSEERNRRQTVTPQVGRVLRLTWARRQAGIIFGQLTTDWTGGRWGAGGVGVTAQVCSPPASGAEPIVGWHGHAEATCIARVNGLAGFSNLLSRHRSQAMWRALVQTLIVPKGDQCPPGIYSCAMPSWAPLPMLEHTRPIPAPAFDAVAHIHLAGDRPARYPPREDAQAIWVTHTSNLAYPTLQSFFALSLVIDCRAWRPRMPPGVHSDTRPRRSYRQANAGAPASLRYAPAKYAGTIFRTKSGEPPTAEHHLPHANMKSPSEPVQKKLRSSCNECHNAKSRCSGERPCQSCARLGLECVYGPSNRMGRPRGTKNKKTLARLNSSEEPKPPTSQADSMELMDDSQDSTTPPSSRGLSVDGDYLAILSTIPDISSMESDTFSNVDPFQFATLQHSPEEDISAFIMPHMEPSTPYVPMLDSPPHSVAAGPTMLSCDHNALAANLFGHSSHLPDSPEPSPCRCLRNQTELFCTLNEFKKTCGPSQVGFILEKVPLALAHWKSALQCLHCDHNQDRDVYNMIALGIRAMLVILASGYAAGYVTGVAAPEQLELSSSRRSSSGGATPPTPRLQFGLYEVTGEDYALVARTLLVRNVERICAILSFLRSCIDKPYSDSRGSSVSGSLQGLPASPLPLDGTEHLSSLAHSLEHRADALLRHIRDDRT